MLKKGKNLEGDTVHRDEGGFCYYNFTYSKVPKRHQSPIWPNMVLISLFAHGLPKPIWANWRFIDVCINSKKTTSKPHLVQHGFYKCLPHPSYEVIMPQWGQKAIWRFCVSGMLESYYSFLGLDWSLCAAMHQLRGAQKKIATRQFQTSIASASVVF